MDRKQGRLVVIFMLVALVTLSCAVFGGSSSSTPTKSSSSSGGGTAAPTKSSAAPTSTTAPKSDVPLGDVQKSDEGGFSFRAIPDYEVNSIIGMVTMTAPGSDPDLGPVMLLAGGKTDQEITLDKLLEDFKSGTSDMTLGEVKKIKVAGADALAADFTTVDKGNNISGRVIVALPSPTHQWTAFGGAEKDTWDKDFAKIFDAVVASVTFFTPTDVSLEPTTQPTTFSATKAPTTVSATKAPTTVSATKAPTAAAGTAVPTASQGGGLLNQWASSAKASSQFAEDGWAAKQAAGEPNTPDCGDSMSAWAPMGSDTQEWLELTYKTPVRPTLLNIIQSYKPSQVVKVELLDVDGKYHQVYTAKPKDMGKECPYTLAIPLAENYLVKGVKISMDQSVLQDWNEIDAVELVGLPSGGGSTDPTPVAQSEFPLTKDAASVTKAGNTTNYQTKLTLKEAIEFYRTELTKLGLKERTINTAITDTVFSMVFDGSKNGKALVVQGVDLGNGSVNINIRYEDL